MVKSKQEPPRIGEHIQSRPVAGTEAEGNETETALSSQDWASLRAWHLANGRHHLPWSAEPTPWRVMVAEVLLHRTRASAVEELYGEVLNHFPFPDSIVQRPDEWIEATRSLGLAWRAAIFVLACEKLVSVHDGQVKRLHSYTISPGLVAKGVPYGTMLAGYGTTWRWTVGRAEKHSIGGAEVYTAHLLRNRSGSLGSAKFVFFKLRGLLEMFRDLQQRIPQDATTKNRT